MLNTLRGGLSCDIFRLSNRTIEPNSKRKDQFILELSLLFGTTQPPPNA